MHSAVLSVTEIQTSYTVKHNTLMLQNTATCFGSAVSSSGTLLQKFQKHVDPSLVRHDESKHEARCHIALKSSFLVLLLHRAFR
jgi:hypothetical protein